MVVEQLTVEAHQVCRSADIVLRLGPTVPERVIGVGPLHCVRISWTPRTDTRSGVRPGGGRLGRKPFKTAEEKLQVVLSVLRGEMTQVEAARRLQMSQTTIAKWQKQFLEGAHESLARGEN